MNFLDILNATLPVFLIVGVGYLTRIVGMVNDDSEKSIMRLVVNVLYPCFILSKIPGNESLQQVSVVGASLGAGFLLTVVGLLVARATGWGLRIDKKSGLNTFTVGAAIQNYGFIPIPMIWALFGDSADETLGV
ncbi:MAG: putative permease, partial [Mariniblastus sp.]